MLFDLRGRGRRRTIQAVYLFLAVLMGGGLIFFGVGTGTGGGGLLNNLPQNGASGAGLARYQSDLKKARQETQTQPNSAASWLALARASFALAQAADYNQTTGAYTDKGKRDLGETQDAWKRYLSLSPSQPDVSTARQVARAFIAINDFASAASAQQIVVDSDPTQASQWALLAGLAYYAGQADKGDLASAKALAAETDPVKRASLKTTLAGYKKNGPAAAAQQANGGGGNAQLPSF